MDADKRPGNYVKSAPAMKGGDSANDDATAAGAQSATGTTETAKRGMGSAMPNNMSAHTFAFKRPLPG